MQNLFLLGAGFSYDVSGKQFPLAGDIMSKISNIDKALKEDYKFGVDYIETCFTRLELDILLKENKDLES
ncbi:MAG: hypothetical protein V1709_11885, partial [Planctomycetota bacterium]